MSSGSVVNADVPHERTGGLSESERVLDTFIAPSKTFSDILRNASWWLPFVLLAVMSAATAFVTARQVGFDRVYENTLSQSPKAMDAMNQLSPEQRATRMAMGANITKYITYAIPVLLLLIYALYALMLWGSFNFLLGAKTTYKQCLSASIYAALPYLLLSLLTILTLSLGGNAEAFDQKNPVGTNLAYFMPDSAPWLRALLSQLDLIRLWSLGLAIYGMSIISRKTIAQAALVVGGLWFLGVLFTVVPAFFS